MRQFVLGLLFAALVWWVWTTWFAVPDSAGPESGGTDSQSLEAMLKNGGGSAGNAPPEESSPASPQAATAPAAGSENEADRAGTMIPLAAGAAQGPSADPALQAAFEHLAARLQQGEATAVAEAWRVLASPQLLSEHRSRLVTLLGSVPDDFEGLLARLGTNNAFLHSGEGRGLAKRAAAAAVSKPDPEAVPAMSRFLELCTRGPIEKAHVEAKEVVEAAYAQHKVRVDRWLFDPANVRRARSVTVGDGDSLGKIAAKFRSSEKIAIESSSLAILNRIHNENAVQKGQKLKVPVDPLHAVVEKRSFLMVVYLGDLVARLYWVGHGADDKTPVTEFTVVEKLYKPDWYAPGGERFPYGHPKNILGDYFIKFGNDRHTGFGAHGTPMPETIGTQSSMGCIRMHAADIAELYRLLPRSARVLVRDSR